MEEMAANIQQNSDNALQTEKIAIQAADNATKSGKAVAETVAAMQEITKKILVVEDIAQQTRLLSLNATIEAARAGDHGKGFAVVAAEVRALAGRSQGAATEINQLASASVTIAETAGEQIEQLVPDIQKTADLVQEISAASKEQSMGTEQINRAIQQLDQVTQQNASTSEDVSSTAEELANQADQLQHTIMFFTTDESEQSTSEEDHAAPAPSPSLQTTPLTLPDELIRSDGDGTPRDPGRFMDPPGQKRDSLDSEFERY